MSEQTAEAPGKRFKFSAQSTALLDQSNCSLVLASSVDKTIYTVGINPEEKPTMVQAQFDGVKAVAATPRGFLVATNADILNFENSRRQGAGPDENGVDGLYARQSSYHIGSMNVQDMDVHKSGRPVFANSEFNCIAHPHLNFSFEILWTNPLMTNFAESRNSMHLSGFAQHDGAPQFASFYSRQEGERAWLQDVREKGYVFHVNRDQVVCEGLTCPHSPRIYKDKLWILNAGTGEFGFILNHEFIPMAKIGGWLKGLRFIGDIAIVGVSQRIAKPIQDIGQLPVFSDGREPESGVALINIRTGEYNIECPDQGDIDDVAILHGIRFPRIDNKSAGVTIAPSERMKYLNTRDRSWRSKPIGSLDVKPLIKMVDDLTPEEWQAGKATQDYLAPGRKVETLYLLNRKSEDETRDPEMIQTEFYDRFWPFVEENIMPIIEKAYDKPGKITQIMIAKLAAGETIGKHFDQGFFLTNAHRIHVPLQTNPDIKFNVEGINMPFNVGEIIELNNTVYHAVYNESDQDRIHFIMDYMEQE